MGGAVCEEEQEHYYVLGHGDGGQRQELLDERDNRHTLGVAPRMLERVNRNLVKAMTGE